MATFLSQEKETAGWVVEKTSQMMRSLRKWYEVFRGSIRNTNPKAWIDIPLLSLLICGNIALRYQGWAERLMNNPDMLPYYTGVVNFLKSGVVMDHGEMSSYNSVNPPGTFFLLLPSAWLRLDPRLIDLPVNFLWNWLSVFFLYAILRKVFNRPVAFVACAAFALSQLGYQSIWPVGHPVYLLGVLFFLLRWRENHSAASMISALGFLAFGLYADLTIIPIAVTIPVVLFLDRQHIRFPAIIISLFLGIVIWLPFFKFELARSFSDLRSLLLRESTPGHANTESSHVYCFATLPGESDIKNDTYVPYLDQQETRLVYSESSPAGQALYRLCSVFLNLDRGWDTDMFFLDDPILRTIPFFLFLSGMFGLGCSLIPLGRGRFTWVTRKPIFLALLIGLPLVVYLLLSGSVVSVLARDGVLSQPVELVRHQAQLFLPLVLAGGLLGFAVRADEKSGRLTYFTIFVWIPWIILLIAAEPGRPERYWWIWPMQVAAAIWFLWRVVEKSALPIHIYTIASLLFMIAVLPVPFFRPKAEAWITRGFAGRDSGQVSMLAMLGSIWNGQGRIPAGYKYFSLSDPQRSSYEEKVQGAWLDILLYLSRRKEVLHTLESGIHPDDILRIVEIPDDMDCQITRSPWAEYRIHDCEGHFMIIMK